MVKVTVIIFMVVILAVFGSPLTSGHPKPIIRISNGQDADIKNYPYQVAVEKDNEQDCGGSILSDTIILTAAHCFLGQTEANVTIRAGSSVRNIGGQKVAVTKLNLHPKFNLNVGFEHDIAVVELATSLTFGEGVQPIQLPIHSSGLVDGLNSTMTGWGLTSADSYPSDQLQVMYVPLVTYLTCQRDYYGDIITSTMVCAGGNRQGACTGDSGGPLVIDGVQFGVVSVSRYMCNNPPFPAVYTNVAEYLDFINPFLNTKVN